MNLNERKINLFIKTWLYDACQVQMPALYVLQSKQKQTYTVKIKYQEGGQTLYSLVI